MDHLLTFNVKPIVSMDFTILGKASNGRENVLFITDEFTVTVQKRDQTANTSAKVLIDEWFMQ